MYSSVVLVMPYVGITTSRYHLILTRRTMGCVATHQISYKVLSTIFQEMNCNSDLIRSVTHIARMSWRAHFRFPWIVEAWLYISAYITGEHSKHAPLTISVGSIKDLYFLQKSECDVCPLTENNRSRFVQRNGNSKVLSRYNYEFYIVVRIVRIRLPVSIGCRCGT
jgi:hypothetical protein